MCAARLIQTGKLNLRIGWVSLSSFIGEDQVGRGRIDDSGSGSYVYVAYPALQTIIAILIISGQGEVFIPDQGEITPDPFNRIAGGEGFNDSSLRKDLGGHAQEQDKYQYLDIDTTSPAFWGVNIFHRASFLKLLVMNDLVENH